MRGSLQLQLFLGLSLAILAAAMASGVLSYRHAFGEAIELQDDQLRQTAALLGGLRFGAPEIEAPGAAEADPESRLILLTAPAGGGWSPREVAPDLPAAAPDGLQTAMIGGVSWRIYIHADARGDRLAIGQQTAARDEIARTSGLRAILPMLGLILLQPLVIGVILRAQLRPLRRAARAIDAAPDFSTALFPQNDLPSEIAPFVAAIRRLTEGLARSVAEQRRFLDAAAHELRTPLTALSLQTQRLDSAPTPEEARARVAALRRGVERTRILLDQLLTLARAQHQAGPDGPTAVLPLLRELLEDLAPLAQDKAIDLGLVEAQDLVLRVGAVDLALVLKNLIANAIQYTPPGGRIDLGVARQDGGARLWVRDAGPGLAPGAAEKVFEPFWRGDTQEEGAGLGLSIVKAVLDRLGARIDLSEPPGGGLEAQVSFPPRLVGAGACGVGRGFFAVRR